MNWLDLLDMFNFIDRADWLLSVLRYRDFGRSVRIEHTDGKTGAGYESMLKRYGVVIFGRRVTSKHLVFSVKTKQAQWAEYLLLRAGAPVVTTFDHRNATWAARHGGQLPPAWRDRKDGRR